MKFPIYGKIIQMLQTTNQFIYELNNRYPLEICYIASWKIAIRSLIYPFKNMIFQFAMLVYQRVIPYSWPIADGSR